jgi:hypothetical protein
LLEIFGLRLDSGVELYFACTNCGDAVTKETSVDRIRLDAFILQEIREASNDLLKQARGHLSATKDCGFKKYEYTASKSD